LSTDYEANALTTEPRADTTWPQNRHNASQPSHVGGGFKNRNVK